MEAARERDRLAGRIEQTGAAIETRRGELEALEVPEAAPDGVRAPAEGKGMASGSGGPSSGSAGPRSEPQAGGVHR